MYRYYHIRGRFDGDVVDEDGYTALYQAVTHYGGSYDAVELLVEAGANLTLPMNNVDSLIKVGWEGVAGNGEASEALSIATFALILATYKPKSTLYRVASY